LATNFTANGIIIQPKFAVKQRRYRLRLLNIGPARWYEVLGWPTARGSSSPKPFLADLQRWQSAAQSAPSSTASRMSVRRAAPTWSSTSNDLVKREEVQPRRSIS